MRILDPKPSANTVNLVIAGNKSVLKGMAIIGKVLWPDVEVHSTSSSDILTGKSIGMMFVRNGDKPWEHLLALLRIGCGRIVLVKADEDLADWWNTADTTIQAAFNEWCVVCTSDIASVANAVDYSLSWCKSSQSPGHFTQNARIARTLEAQNVFSLLGGFSHNGAADIANQFLAPTRMLLLKGDADAARSIWKNTAKKLSDDFNEHVCSEIESNKDAYGELGQEVCRTHNAITTWYEGNTAESSAPLIDNLSRLMGLMTEARVLASRTVDTARPTEIDDVEAAPVVKSLLEPKHPHYNIAVIDDNAVAWRPIFEALAEMLSNRLHATIRIEFSLDGERVKTGTSVPLVSLWQLLPEYDLVLLDVYLPNKRGDEILRQIRQRVMQLPVIMWTTSTERELPAGASLSNGFLFKKAATLEQLAGTIETWLAIGKSKRLVSLPNPFFDHLIQSPGPRQCALKFTHWCLKYLDSFHALDNDYFRFFNDHGGRHIIGLLNILEQLLRPLLFDGRIFSSSPQEREMEVLSLYLGVLCHEFGMFPVGQVHGFAGHDQKILNRIRDTHAIQSFLTLMQPPKSQRDFEALVTELKQVVSRSHAQAALISAYHSRFLSLKHFGTLAYENPQKAGLLQEDNREELLKDQLQKAITVAAPDASSLTRTKSLCGLFRFADSLDVDRTRVPADFILRHVGRPPQQDVEDCKRLVVNSVHIERGEVRLSFSGPNPCGRKWSEDTERIPDFLRSLESLKPEQGERATSLFNALRAAYISAGVGSPSENETEIARNIKKTLDKWLLPCFQHRRTANGHDVAVIAALSVICDIREEYVAIETIALDTVIRLGAIEWDLQADNIDILLKDGVAKGPTGKYEFKFVLPLGPLGGDIFNLIRDKRRIGKYLVHSCEGQRLTDIYFDTITDEYPDGVLARQGICCRKRSINRNSFLETKRTLTPEKDYLNYVRTVHSCKEGTNNLPSSLRDEIPELNNLPQELSSVAVIYNHRIVMGLGLDVTTDVDAWICLDEYFAVTDRDHLDGPLPEPYREIEVISDNPEVLMDLGEVLSRSFRLVQVEKGKAQRVMRGLRTSKLRQSIWMDVDTGVDDAMALLLALRSPDKCDLVAVSVVGGNVDVKQAVVNTAKVIQYAGVAVSPPIFPGCASPGCSGDARDVHGPDGIGDISKFTSHVESPPHGELVSGFQTIVGGLGASEITFVATGPLTNLAHLIKECPAAVRGLKHLVIMGGAFDEPGNREALPEFNIFSDPESARSVLAFCREHKIRHTFVPLDVTHRVILKSEFIERFRRDGNAADFIGCLTEDYRRFYERNQAMGGCPMHDPMAVGFVLWPELFTSDNFHVEIAPSGSGPFSGATSADFRPTRLFRDRKKQVTEIVLRVDQKRFLERIAETLLGAA